MSRRVRARHFDEEDARLLLEALRQCRKACIQARSKVPIHGDLYSAAGGVMNAIDIAAEVLTGNREHFWMKSH